MAGVCKDDLNGKDQGDAAGPDECGKLPWVLAHPGFHAPRMAWSGTTVNREVCRAPQGLAFDVALAVRPAGVAEAPGSTAAEGASRAAGCEALLRLEGPPRTMRGIPHSL